MSQEPPTDDADAATSKRVQNFVDLAGTVSVPVEKRGLEWGDVVSAVRWSRAHR